MGVDRFVVEIEPEVRDWLTALPARHYALVEGRIDLLAEVTRASWAQKTCESEHSPAHEEFSRIVRYGEQW
ncbi:hypothetical protein [Streptomyces sp. CBMA156]|uniref:hypothetical protein n=1 Tax=Streptomyces sp. CBMA156 TaxID=1930280 RepID=UPI00166208E9|nr:hypothetical protein [Streptomyces sp. CBMA156]